MRRIWTFYLFALLGGVAGLSSPAYADDIELYLGRAQETNELNRPNILFMFAASDSMLLQLRNKDGAVDADGNNIQGETTGTTRLAALQEALTLVLKEVDNVNIGFGRFTHTTGNMQAPILYPVKYVNEDVIPGDGSSTAAPMRAGPTPAVDDAEESDAGVVNTTNSVLKATYVTADDAPLVEGSLTQTISVLENHAYEIDTKTYVPGNNAALPVGGVTVDNKGVITRTHTAVRFTGLNIPAGATITKATVTFKATAAVADAATLNLKRLTDSSVFVAGNATNLTPRATEGSVDWALPATSVGADYETPDLKEWFSALAGVSDAEVAIIMANTASSAAAERSFGSTRTGTPPLLTLSWVAPDASGAHNQTVGVRFGGVTVPSKVTIIDAYITFTAAADGSGPANLTLKGEASGDAQPYDASKANNITTRAVTTAKADWAITDPWTAATAYQSPDLKNVVQELVNQTNWCGGNSMGFMLTATSGSPLRELVATDGGNGAPVLNVVYDANSMAADSCMTQTYFGRISRAIDDAEERTSVGDVAANDMWLNSGTLELGQSVGGDGSETASVIKRIVGLRFQAVPVRQGSRIIKAELVMEAAGDNTSANHLYVDGQLSSNASSFTTTPGNLSDTLARPRTPQEARSDWSAGFWSAGNSYRVDITKAVQAIVNQTDWASYNNMAFFITPADDNSGLRTAVTYDASATRAPAIEITVADTLGSESSSGLTMKVRDYLLQVVDEMRAGGSQVFSDAMYEGSLYYASGAINFGTGRNNSPTNRVSHPASWYQDTGNLCYSTSAGCPTAEEAGCYLMSDPYSIPCQKETIQSQGGLVPRYISPIKPGSCGPNYLVMVSDGTPTQNTVAGTVNSAIGCTDTGWLPRKLSQNEKCGPELAGFLKDIDKKNDALVRNLFDDKSNLMVLPMAPVTTHTVGFALGKGWQITDSKDPNSAVVKGVVNGVYQGLEDPAKTQANQDAKDFMKLIAKQGGGDFYTAENAQELAEALKSIIDKILSDNASFVAPTLTVNAFNRMSHENAVYFATFKPSHTHRWAGNVKKYTLCDEQLEKTLNCSFGEVLDANKDPIAVPSDVDPNLTVLSSKSVELWNDYTRVYTTPAGTLTTKDDPTAQCEGCDDGIVQMAGAGEQVPAPDDRLLFTNLSGDSVTFSSAAGNTTDVVKVENTALTAEVLGVAADQRDTVVKWIRGIDTQDEDRDDDITDPRWTFGDPLHSRPVAVNYAYYTDSEAKERGSLSKLFVGTNDGVIHMLDARTGAEEWAFIPKEMLAIQNDLRLNKRFDRNQRIYGIDGTPASLQIDKNKNSIIEPDDGDSVKIFIGMRRGGRNVYALDVTPDEQIPYPASLTTPIKITPKLLWVLRGGGVDGALSHLGQTWSRPKAVKVRFDGYPKGRDVVLFGGGYDPSTQDNPAARTKTNIGNAIYMVDPDDGTVLWWASKSESGANLQLAGMEYSIPSDLTVIDGDGDDYMDRIYVGDTGGQLWRIDLGTALDGGVGHGGSVGGILASIANENGRLGTVPASEMRRFFYPPDLAMIYDSTKEFSNAEKFFAIVITSGYRPEPTDAVIHDRLYVFRDRAERLEAKSATDRNAAQDTEGWLLAAPAGATDSSVSVPQDKGYMTGFTTITHAYMYNASEHLIQSTDATVAGAEAEEIRPSLGWYYDLEDNGSWIGEKGTEEPSIISGKVHVPTFVPDMGVNSDVCVSMAGGQGRMYILDILAGRTTADLAPNGEPGEDTPEYIDLGTALPPKLSLYVDKTKGSGLGPNDETLIKIGNDVELPRTRIYWIEE